MIHLSKEASLPVQIETIAALANLAVNDDNEETIGRQGGLPHILEAAASQHEELMSQASRALRNLSVNPKNRDILRDIGAIPVLEDMINVPNMKIRSQALRALQNLNGETEVTTTHK